MSDTKQYDTLNVRVIHNRRLKHTYVSVDRDAYVTVKTPIDSDTYVRELLEEKSPWIHKQLKKIQELQRLSPEILYSLEYIQDRVVFFSQEMDLEYTVLRFRKMKSRWGSCSSKGVITLNTHLQRVKAELIDYVIVHELSHLVHMNHSKAFHSHVESYLEGAKSYAKELKKIRLT